MTTYRLAIVLLACAGATACATEPASSEPLASLAQEADGGLAPYDDDLAPLAQDLEGELPAYDDDSLEVTLADGEELTDKLNDIWEMDFSGSNIFLGATRAEAVCFLSEVRGNFSSNGTSEVILPTSGANKDRWLGNGRGRAVCVRLGKFVGTQKWIGDDSATARFFSDGNAFGCGSVRAGNIQNLWLGDAPSFLTSVRGEFESSRYAVRINQSGSAFLPSTVEGIVTASCNHTDRDVSARGRSFFIGRPGSNVPATWVSRTSTGTFFPTWQLSPANATVTFAVNSGGTREVEMIPVSMGVCGLTKVSGDLNGSAEKVTITQKSTPEDVFWVLRASAGSGSSAQGEARCMSFGTWNMWGDLPTPIPD